MSQCITSASSVAESVVAICYLRNLDKERGWSLWIQAKQWGRGRQGLISPVWRFRLGSETKGNLFTCIYLWFNQWAQVQTFWFMRERARSDTREKGGWEKKRVTWKGKDPQLV